MKVSEAYLNGVMAYSGLAAVDFYIGAAQVAQDDPLNKIHPGEFKYGGGHVIQDLVAGKDVLLEAYGYGTDCYPRRKLVTWINLADLNEAYLFNPRNAYQNYNVARTSLLKPCIPIWGSCPQIRQCQLFFRRTALSFA